MQSNNQSFLLTLFCVFLLRDRTSLFSVLLCIVAEGGATETRGETTTTTKMTNIRARRRPVPRLRDFIDSTTTEEEEGAEWRERTREEVTSRSRSRATSTSVLTEGYTGAAVNVTFDQRSVLIGGVRKLILSGCMLLLMMMMMMTTQHSQIHQDSNGLLALKSYEMSH
jgi:hypothetical protein